MTLEPRAVIVLDVGKTQSTLSLWSPTGDLLERRSRLNARVATADYIALDSTRIEGWLAATLSEFAYRANVGSIITVGHGAAAAIVRSGQLVCPPLDFESPIPSAFRREYDRERDSFAITGSPALDDGHNLGAQLHYLEKLYPGLLAPGSIVMPWAQYWGWLLSGVAASEVTSLGCHTDLWQPLAGKPSPLAIRRGWWKAMAPLRPAGAVLGTLTSEWAALTGLRRDVRVYCGLHDSNAALLAARGFPDLNARDCAVLSTGTWFVAMRTPPRDALDGIQAPENRDCLMNVDAFGKPVPSARFMGGREIELLTGQDTPRIGTAPDQSAVLAAIPEVLAMGAMILPTFAPGSGPFARRRGCWISRPAVERQRRATICLYAALVADTAMELIGARDGLLIEGRFAESEALVRAIATLRPDIRVYVGHAHADVSYGALRLLNPAMASLSPLTRVKPLPLDLQAYRERWHREIDGLVRASG